MKWCVGSVVVVKLSNAPYLCKTDEVGELCVSAPYSGTEYWGLAGVSNSTFKVRCSHSCVAYCSVCHNL